VKIDKKKELKMTQIYMYLNKRGLCDEVHKWGEHEYIFYHWNKVKSNLIPSLVVYKDKISEIKYSRDLIPVLFSLINYTIINDLKAEYKFVRGVKNGEEKQE
jgi:hypothetical protein